MVCLSPPNKTYRTESVEVPRTTRVGSGFEQRLGFHHHKKLSLN